MAGDLLCATGLPITAKRLGRSKSKGSAMVFPRHRMSTVARAFYYRRPGPAASRLWCQPGVDDIAQFVQTAMKKMAHAVQRDEIRRRSTRLHPVAHGLERHHLVGVAHDDGPGDRGRRERREIV